MFLPPPPPEPKPNPVTTPPEAVDAVEESPPIEDESYLYALECLLKGSKPAEVRKSLLAAGHTGEEANQIVQYALNYQQHHAADVPEGGGMNTNMWLGGAICLLGLVITLGSLMISGDLGGRYVIAHGAIIWGAVQFCRGLAQSKSSL